MHQVVLQPGEMHVDDALHRLAVGKADVVKKAAPQKGVGQFLLIVRGDHDNGPLLRDDRLLQFVDKELHAVEFEQEVVRELDVGLVDLVDQQDRRGVRDKGVPQFARLDVVRDVAHALVAKLAVAQP